ncbi:MAG TPA: M23 family metallopeptidase [Candidatus Limnocylindrales bacterium]
MPRQHFPTSRPRRRIGIARAALIGAAAAVVIVLALPATTPRGDVLDIVTDHVGSRAAAGQEPEPVAAREAPAAGVGDNVEAPPAAGAAARFVDPRRPYLVGPIEDPAASALPAAAPPVDTLSGYVWPIAHPRLTLKFGPTDWGSFVVDGKPFHDGIDIATFCGDRIVAAHDGTVLAAGRRFDKHIGWVGDLGPYLARLDRKNLWNALPLVVVIDDGNGYRSMYAHFGKVVVKRGQKVHAGQLLGFEGATGHATGCHLHYGLFSPAEEATFKLRKGIAGRMKLPRYEIARIDPLSVLPHRRGNHVRDGDHPRDS